MKLEDQVCSLELAKKLKELGFEQNSLFYWNSKKSKIVFGNLLNVAPVDFDKLGYYSAYTVAELGGMLPDKIENPIAGEDPLDIKFDFNIIKQQGWMVYLEDFDFNTIEKFVSETEADARAKCLIYLKENNLI